MNIYSPLSSACECVHWVRSDSSSGFKTSDGLPLITNHHPNCSHYNDSLMDVWQYTIEGKTCCFASESEAERSAVEDAGMENPPTIEKTTMHREVFENLPEFEGF